MENPIIRIMLAPEWDGEKIPKVKVCISGGIGAEKEERLFGFNLVSIFKPFNELADSVKLGDEAGDLAFRTEIVQEGMIKREYYYPLRKTCGNVRLSYSVKLKEAGRNPVFDLGYEKGGMNGSGMTFMPALAEGEYDYEMDWNLEQLPFGCRGVWSFGEGRVKRTGDADTLQQTFYSAGQLDGVKLGRFAYYWLNNPLLLKTASDTAQIFSFESEFFKDEDNVYTVFARQTPEEQTRAGGTAFRRSYMFVYGDNDQLDPVWLRFLFAHEMVHNWISLEDMPFGTCTWYVEGAAEFYSVLLPWRMGISDVDEICKEMNKRAASYYENPEIGCTNAEAGAGLMSDKEKTLIPYGRGFFYLLHADSVIREKSQGRCSLDDVVMAISERYKKDRSIRNEAWIEEYGRFAGKERAIQELEEMSRGNMPDPGVLCFEGSIKAEKITSVTRGTDTTCVSWRFNAS